jgi:hypothetical protein
MGRGIHRNIIVALARDEDSQGLGEPIVIYIRFTAPDGGSILVEADEGESKPSPGGVVKAGLKDRVQGAVNDAQDAFEDALQRVVRFNAQAIIEAVRALPKQPTDVEVSFGLKVTGEAGNFAVCKAGGEVNYAIKLAWKTTQE